jgi:hypothetical protein
MQSYSVHVSYSLEPGMSRHVVVTASSGQAEIQSLRKRSR